MARNIHICHRKKTKNTLKAHNSLILKYLSKKNRTRESFLLHSCFLSDLHGNGHLSGRLTSGGTHTFSFISNLQHTPTQNKPLTGAILPSRPDPAVTTHHAHTNAHLLTCWSSHSISTTFWPGLRRHGSRVGGAWVVVGTVVGWNTWVVVAGVAGVAGVACSGTRLSARSQVDSDRSKVKVGRSHRTPL